MLTPLKKPLCSLFKSLQLPFSSLPQSSASSAIAKNEKLQFSKARLTDFGELPTGEVPEVLKYDHISSVSKLENGVRLGCETWNSPLATISLKVKAGTRNETLQTSGVSQFIKKLSLCGTTSKSKAQVEKELDLLGGNYSVDVSRETTTFTLTVLPEHAGKAVEFLSDVVMNPLLNKNQVEAEKAEIYRQSAENHRDQMDVTLESAHYTSYRDHFIGQPVLGIRENIANITQEQIKEFHANNYVASNMVLVGAGNVKAEELGNAASKVLGKLPNVTASQKNLEKPYFTPSTMFMRDDEMSNVNIGVFLNAPTWKDPEFFAMKIIQALLGEYQASKHTGAHLNSAKRQYSTLHEYLGSYPDVTLHKCLYFPYEDTALFGNYLYGNEIFGYQMLYVTQSVLTEYASHINHAEFFRARSAVYNALLTKNNTIDIASIFGNQLMYLNRRVPRSEVATRISHMTPAYISNVITNWFWDRDLSAVAWGPIHNLIQFSHYNRPLKRSTLGWYGTSHLLVV